MSVSKVAVTGTMFAVGVTLMGCGGTHAIDGVGLSNPPFSATSIDCTTTDKQLQENYIAYATARDKLKFPSLYHNTLGDSTGFVADLVDPPTLGPVVELWPEERSLHNGGGALVEGRIVAKIDNRGMTTFLDIPPGISYIAICKVNKDDKTATALIIPVDPNEDMVTMTNVWLRKVRGRKHADAVIQGGKSTICVTCEHNYWCHIDP